jgi:hypothetical protein
MDTRSLAVFIKDGNEAEIEPLFLRGLDINFTFEQVSTFGLSAHCTLHCNIVFNFAFLYLHSCF